MPQPWNTRKNVKGTREKRPRTTVITHDESTLWAKDAEGNMTELGKVEDLKMEVGEPEIEPEPEPPVKKISTAARRSGMMAITSALALGMGVMPTGPRR